VVALLLEENPRLTPRDAKAVLQMTSSFMPGEGLIASGAGSLNALAAAELVAGESRARLPRALIAGEIMQPVGVDWGTAATGTIYWGTAASHSCILTFVHVHSDFCIQADASSAAWAPEHAF
jgi:hypothetical protein